MLSAPGCWAMFCEVLEKEYSDMIYAKAHHYTVDSYACQHPGNKENKQAINSVGVHLSSLYMLLENSMSMSEGGNFKNKFSEFNKQADFIHWLKPPKPLGKITVFDIWNLEDSTQHFSKCKQWAESTWYAWHYHHNTIKDWVKYFLEQESHNFKSAT